MMLDREKNIAKYLQQTILYSSLLGLLDSLNMISILPLYMYVSDILDEYVNLYKYVQINEYLSWNGERSGEVIGK